MIYIGIDPGTHTGFAVWDSKQCKFLELETFHIHTAMNRVLHWRLQEPTIKVIFEDARQRTWFGKGNVNAKKQGAGSVKRDCAIWEDFCEDYNIEYHAIHPLKGGTKLTKEYFSKLTGWNGRTSEHSRDAAMIVIGRR